MRRWSKLKKRIEDLLVPGAEVHLILYRMNKLDHTRMPRLTIKHDDIMLFDYPKAFRENAVEIKYPYRTPPFSDMIDTYINTNPAEISKLSD